MRIWSNRARLFRNSSHPDRNMSRGTRPNGAAKTLEAWRQSVRKVHFDGASFPCQAASGRVRKMCQPTGNVPFKADSGPEFRRSRLSEECLVNSVTHRRRKRTRSGSSDDLVALSSVMKNQFAAGFVPFRESSASFSKWLLSFRLRAIATTRRAR